MNQTCEINILTRHTCAFCRLQKCSAIGMSSHLIRKEDIKKAKTSKSNSNKSITVCLQSIRFVFFVFVQLISLVFFYLDKSRTNFNNN